MVDEPEHRAEIDASLQDVYATLFLDLQPDLHQGRAEPARPQRRRRCACRWSRPPPTSSRRYGRCSNATACSPAPARRAHPRVSSSAARPAPRRARRDRQEHDRRRVRRSHRRRRRGPALPDARRWSASTSCCPTSPTCASALARSRRSSSPTATRTTSGRCRGCCASCGNANALPPVYGGALTMAMARSKLEEHKLRDVELTDVEPGETLELGPFSLELVHMTHSIPDSSAVALGTDLGTVLITGDYKFDQTPVDGAPADVSRLAELGREGVLLLCGDSTNVDRAGLLAVGVRRRTASRGGVRPLRRAHRGDELRVQHPPRAAGRGRRRRRSTARSRWSGARCARTSASGAPSAISRSPRGCSSGRGRSTTSPTSGS